MTAKTFVPIREAYERLTSPLSRKVLEYSFIFKDVVDRAQAAGGAIKIEDWEPLSELVDVANFRRVGQFKEEMNWAEYTGFVTQFAGGTKWEGSLKRITEVDGVVWLELEERCTTQGHTDVSNTLTVYEFNDAGKLVHLDVYVQSTAVEFKQG